ncbi:unnamed protein product, partial [Amoebophrya sp. A120]
TKTDRNAIHKKCKYFIEKLELEVKPNERPHNSKQKEVSRIL